MHRAQRWQHRERRVVQAASGRVDAGSAAQQAVGGVPARCSGFSGAIATGQMGAGGRSARCSLLCSWRAWRAGSMLQQAVLAGAGHGFSRSWELCSVERHAQSVFRAWRACGRGVSAVSKSWPPGTMQCQAPRTPKSQRSLGPAAHTAHCTPARPSIPGPQHHHPPPTAHRPPTPSQPWASPSKPSSRTGSCSACANAPACDHAFADRTCRCSPSAPCLSASSRRCRTAGRRPGAAWTCGTGYVCARAATSRHLLTRLQQSTTPPPPRHGMS